MAEIEKAIEEEVIIPDDEEVDIEIEAEEPTTFEEAINVVDKRKNWPEPRDLAVEYWKARTAKNYDEIAMFWPGSATWNRQVIENEEPVEYVFGKVQTTEMEDNIIVPYATKSYYEKNRKYSLKMRLTNKKSSKGLYYIYSGN